MDKSAHDAAAGRSSGCRTPLLAALTLRCLRAPRMGGSQVSPRRAAPRPYVPVVKLEGAGTVYTSPAGRAGASVYCPTAGEPPGPDLGGTGTGAPATVPVVLGARGTDAGLSTGPRAPEEVMYAITRRQPPEATLG